MSVGGNANRFSLFSFS